MKILLLLLFFILVYGGETAVSLKEGFVNVNRLIPSARFKMRYFDFSIRKRL